MQLTMHRIKSSNILQGGKDKHHCILECNVGGKTTSFVRVEKYSTQSDFRQCTPPSR
jgi:hypothetical protein